MMTLHVERREERLVMMLAKPCRRTLAVEYSTAAIPIWKPMLPSSVMIDHKGHQLPRVIV